MKRTVSYFKILSWNLSVSRRETRYEGLRWFQNKAINFSKLKVFAHFPYSLLPLIRERSACPGLLGIQMHHQRPGCCGRNLSLGGGATIVRTSCNQSESLSKNLELRRKGSVPKMPVAV
jgi:hypothetical protein